MTEQKRLYISSGGAVIITMTFIINTSGLAQQIVFVFFAMDDDGNYEKGGKMLNVQGFSDICSQQWLLCEIESVVSF